MSKTLSLPDSLTPAIDDALGGMIFHTAPIAHLFRDTGEPIPRKAEREQAFVLFWFLSLALEHGDGWRAVAGVEIERRIQIIRSRQAEST